MEKIELLAPAGNLERLKWAIDYGADAVYIGGEKYSLRANAINFSIDEIKEGVEYAHKFNKKVYVTVNIVFHNEELDGITEYLKELEKAKVDAIISSDLFIIDLLKENNINIEFHLSTQASTLNSMAARFYKNEGVKRVVLARECSVDEIAAINKENIDTEVFVHGAMCMGYSGRCTLSNYITNRDSNRGGCAQVCRWVFDLYDKNKIIVDEKNKFAIAPKDLCYLNYIPDLIDLGVKSLKIEGRMKSIYYVSTLISVYRRVIDEYYNNKKDFKIGEKDKIILDRCANRESSPQYFKEKPGVNEQYYMGREELTNQDFLGVVLDYDKKNKEITIEQRNYFKIGDNINIFGPNNRNIFLKVKYIKNEDGEFVNEANHPKEILKIYSEDEVYPNDLMRVDFLSNI